MRLTSHVPGRSKLQLFVWPDCRGAHQYYQLKSWVCFTWILGKIFFILIPLWALPTFPILFRLKCSNPNKNIVQLAWSLNDFYLILKYLFRFHRFRSEFWTNQSSVKIRNDEKFLLCINHRLLTEDFYNNSWVSDHLFQSNMFILLQFKWMSWNFK